MPGLFIANIAAPFILSVTGNIFIFLSIIPVEMIVIWLFFYWVSKIKIAFPRLLIAVLSANTVTSILGIPLVYNIFISGSPIVILLVLPISFVLSFLIESIIYNSLLKKTYQISRLRILISSFLSNLSSYTIFALVLLPTTLNSSWLTTANPSRARFDTRMFIPNYLSVQKHFYEDNNHFADTFAELGYSGTKDTSLYRFELQAEKKKVSITATAKVKNIRSYRGTVFVVKEKSQSSPPQFVSGVCQTNEPSITPPNIPQLVNGNLQCPPGSVDIDSQSKN